MHDLSSGWGQPIIAAKMHAKAAKAKSFMKKTEDMHKLGERQQAQNLVFHCRIVQEKEIRYDGEECSPAESFSRGE